MMKEATWLQMIFPSKGNITSRDQHGSQTVELILNLDLSPCHPWMTVFTLSAFPSTSFMRLYFLSLSFVILRLLFSSLVTWVHVW